MIARCPPLISHLACFLAGVMAAVHGMEPNHKPGSDLKPQASVVRQSMDGKRCVMGTRLYEGRYRYKAIASESGDDLAKLHYCEDEPQVTYD
jgi:hypothetical protein